MKNASKQRLRALEAVAAAAEEYLDATNSEEAEDCEPPDIILETTNKLGAALEQLRCAK